MATGSATKVVAAVIVVSLVLHSTTCMQPGQSESKPEVKDTFLEGVREMLAIMNWNVKPCDDFYSYACGNWPKRHPVLTGQSLVDTNIAMDADLSNKLKDLLAEDIRAEDGKPIALAKTLYQSCMDESEIDNWGASLLIGLMNKEFGGWPLLQKSTMPADGSQASSSTRGSSSQSSTQPGTKWIRLMGTLMTYNDEAIIGVGARQSEDLKYAIHLYPASLGMSLDQFYSGLLNVETYDQYFFQSAMKYNPNLRAYAEYIAKTALLLDADEETLQSDVQEILEFELKLARILKTAESKGSLADKSTITLKALKSSMPSINWDIFFEHSLPKLRISPYEPIELDGSTIISAILDLAAYSTSERTVINYLLWRFVMNRMDTLGTPFVESKREFEAQISGSSEINTSRNQVCLDLVNSRMGLVVSSLYAKRYFNDKSKKEVETMIDSIHAHFSNILMNVDCISDSADSMLQTIGSPEGIPDQLPQEYQQFEFSPNNFFGTVIKILKLNAELAQSKLRETSSQNEWILSPSTGKISYISKKYHISLPACALQPPLFHPGYPKSLNYGGLGSFIGHEISRGFHSTGQDHGDQICIRRWFGTRTANQFDDQTQCMIEQYDSCSTEIGGKVVEVDGTRALPESVSDKAGVRAAFMAYSQYKRLNGREDILPFLQLTHDQMFFIKFAQNFCQKFPQHSLPDALKDSPYLFGKFRVMGTLSNLKEFSDTFECPAGSPMNPEKSAKFGRQLSP